LRFISNRPSKTIAASAKLLVSEAVSSIQALFNEKNVALEINLDINPNIKLLAEPKAIPNALIAILENALAVSKENDVVQLDAYIENQKMILTIADQGPGIASTIIDSLFEPFSTTSANGTGLGLSIAKNTFEAHRGSIAVENRKQGAVFTIGLPILTEK